MANFKLRDSCMLCGARELELVLPIRPSPVADAFVPEARLAEAQELYPLATYLCRRCGHVQTPTVVDPDILFRDYTYRTSVSLGLVEHFANYAQSIIERLKIAPNSLIVEIGSNDGSLLKAFKQRGMRVVGIDPARGIAEGATREGVPTIPEFFTPEIAAAIRAEHGEAALVCANNVFAHIENIDGIVQGIKTLLGPAGAFVFEVSYVVAMADNLVFDVIYHEHISHHSLIPLERFFRKHGMMLFDVEPMPTKGGSIRGYARLVDDASPVSPRLTEMMATEKSRGADKPEFYHEFFRQIEKRKTETLRLVDAAIAEGKTVAGYGASTTTTTLLYHFELESRLKFIVDDNPIKQGLYSPAAHIPVFPSSALLEKKPDIVVILAWMYAEPIIKRNQAYLDAGGSFLVPLPETKIRIRD